VTQLTSPSFSVFEDEGVQKTKILQFSFLNAAIVLRSVNLSIFGRHYTFYIQGDG
jgi:hypothetical protein